MKYGICPISIVPLRLEARDQSEMISQVLYGEVFKIIEYRKKWSKIRLHNDQYEGWLDNKQLLEISSEEYHELADGLDIAFAKEPLSIVTHKDSTLSTLVLGSQVSSASFLGDKFQSDTVREQAQASNKEQIIDHALLMLNAPYLWGGRSCLGIDCSGFTQLMYRLNGYRLSRDASQQATHGQVLSFIEESDPGDLAFFDNTEGAITHVGIIMKDNHIIHAHGKVRIDRLDQSGIFNLDSGSHTHKLRMIKKIL
ncbi:C40 family peptidase [Nonlabens marinus]|uniref:Dipeptidyl peptidase VI n=1 Tax=Nonlabens marinus S1-08 TaxID=1454201 RepID=W8VT16_9FLAO|nr:C40 family peptidase [Nonlabens marinus]BAO56675.1 dipeptidyl peptidase VI [Nonlabens marinus S1-08]